MNDFNVLSDDKVIKKTIGGLIKNGINALVVNNGKEALKKVLELIPRESQVMTMSSVTLVETGITKEINESGKYDSVKDKLSKMNRETQNLEMQKLGAAPSWAIGSVHAVTQDGHVFVASNTGSQLPAYIYGSEHVIWIVGAQKIVKDDNEALSRIYDYVLPKESARLAKKMNDPNVKSNVSKLLIVNKEVNPKRITLILVKEALGF